MFAAIPIRRSTKIPHARDIVNAARANLKSAIHHYQQSHSLIAAPSAYEPSMYSFSSGPSFVKPSVSLKQAAEPRVTLTSVPAASIPKFARRSEVVKTECPCLTPIPSIQTLDFALD